MILIQLTLGCIVAGAQRDAGEVIEVSEADATTLLSINRAVLYIAPPTSQVAADEAALQASRAQLEADLKAGV